jgi:hypothetical protein
MVLAGAMRGASLNLCRTYRRPPVAGCIRGEVQRPGAPAGGEAQALNFNVFVPRL